MCVCVWGTSQGSQMLNNGVCGSPSGGRLHLVCVRGRGGDHRLNCLCFWQVPLPRTHPSLLSSVSPPPSLPSPGLFWCARRCVTQRRWRLICDLDGHLILSHRVGMCNLFKIRFLFGGGCRRPPPLRERDDQSAVPFVSALYLRV